MVKDVDQLISAQSLTLTTTHTLEELLKHPQEWWVRNARMTHYQPLLLNTTKITFQVPSALNLATLLPDPDLKVPLLDCSGITAKTHSMKPDFWDTPLTNFIQDNGRCVRVAIIIAEETIWAESMSTWISTQSTVLLSLTKAFDQSKGRRSMSTPMVIMHLPWLICMGQYTKKGYC